NARNHEDHDEVEQRPEPDPVQVALDQGCDPDDEPGEEEQRSRDAEEQQRLAAEAQLEPHREQVEHPDGDPAETELGLAGPPRIRATSEGMSAGRYWRSAG